MGQPFGKLNRLGDLFDVGTNDCSHLHHVDRLTFLDVAEVSYFAGLAGGEGVAENRKQLAVSHDELACVFGLAVLCLGLEAVLFDVVPELFGDLCAWKLACAEERSQVGFKFYRFVESFGFVCHGIILFVVGFQAFAWFCAKICGELIELGEVLECRDIAIEAEPGNHADAGGSGHGMLPDFFAFIDVTDVNFDNG